jgi:hypothetical protein
MMKTALEQDLPEYCNTTKYDDRIVAFLDILGFSELVYSESNITPFAGIFETINSEEYQRNFIENPSLKDLTITSMSDSIAISIKHDDADCYDKLIRLLLGVITLFADNNNILRGAITQGKLYHCKNIIFGPAFVKAYKLERDIAIYPRCIIDDSVKEDLLALGKRGEAVFDYFIEDFDGNAYLDVIPYIINSIPRDPGYLQTLQRIHSLLVENLRKFKNIQGDNNSKILLKYKWYAIRFNYVLHVTGRFAELIIPDSDIY